MAAVAMMGSLPSFQEWRVREQVRGAGRRCGHRKSWNAFPFLPCMGPVPGRPARRDLKIHLLESV